MFLEVKPTCRREAKGKGTDFKMRRGCGAQTVTKATVGAKEQTQL